MVDVPLPDFDFDEDISFSYDDVFLSSPQLTANYDINQIIESFGFILKIKTPLKSTSNSMVFCSEISCSDDLNALKISSNRQRIMTEFENSTKIQECPYLVKYYDIFDDDSYVFLQMELCTYGDITCKKMDEALIWKLIHDIGLALDDIHKSDYMHLDVSPSNILMDENNVFNLEILEHYVK